MYDPLRSCRGPMPVLVARSPFLSGPVPERHARKMASKRPAIPCSSFCLDCRRFDPFEQRWQGRGPVRRKYSLDERRPNGGKESFPSGHTSISFSAAEFMRKGYGWEYGVPGCLRLQASEAHTPNITNVILTNQQIAVVHHGNLA